MDVMLPDGSIYFWMYEQGLKQTDLGEILYQAAREGRNVRAKDIENYWNGWYNHQLYRSPRDIMSFDQPGSRAPRTAQSYSSYPMHPLLEQPEIINRWVPCSAEGKPLIKWSQGCMTKVDAMSMRGCVTLAENLKGTKMIVIDCDGDHDKQKLDLDTIGFLAQFRNQTHCMSKPKNVCAYSMFYDGPIELASIPASFHLTFTVDRVIPTMHFQNAHIDIIGNKMNSLRYMKNKVWNGIDAIPMTDEIWNRIMAYITERS